jgi:hypothetical protein
MRGKITFCANADLDSNVSTMFGVDSRRKYFGQESGGYDIRTWSDSIVTDKSQLRPNSEFTWRSPNESDVHSRQFYGNWPEALIANWAPVAVIYVPGEGAVSHEEIYDIAQGLPVKNTRGVVLKPL